MTTDEILAKAFDLGLSVEFEANGNCKLYNGRTSMQSCFNTREDLTKQLVKLFTERERAEKQAKLSNLLSSLSQELPESIDSIEIYSHKNFSIGSYYGEDANQAALELIRLQEQK